jgi:hypothetical protein
MVDHRGVEPLSRTDSPHNFKHAYLQPGFYKAAGVLEGDWLHLSIFPIASTTESSAGLRLSFDPL